MMSVLFVSPAIMAKFASSIALFFIHSPNIYIFICFFSKFNRPNLTDDYWLHGGSLSDVYKSVKNGWPAKGMKSWATDLSPLQIKNVASYIKTLHGTNPPNAKAPQGDLYQPEGSKTVQTSSDTTKPEGI